MTKTFLQRKSRIFKFENNEYMHVTILDGIKSINYLACVSCESDCNIMAVFLAFFVTYPIHDKFLQPNQ